MAVGCLDIVVGDPGWPGCTTKAAVIMISHAAKGRAARTVRTAPIGGAEKL